MTSDEKTTDRVSFDERRAAIRRIREGVGMRQAELAATAQVSQSKLSEFEAGKRNFGIAALERIVAALDTAVAERRFALNNLTTLAAVLGGAKRSPVTHYMNLLERTPKGGFLLEYQGPGMPVCEDYRFSDANELLEFLQKCFAAFERVILASDLPRED